jgi:CRP-like cAMP-binding protein
MADALAQARSLIEDRIKELDDERKRLERALADLTGTRRGPGRPRGSTGSSNGRRRSAGTPKRRRRRRGGTRAEQALKHVTENPGIRASEIASKMSIKPNYVYRVMSELESDGKVKKKGREYHPAGASSK